MIYYTFVESDHVMFVSYFPICKKLNRPVIVFIKYNFNMADTMQHCNSVITNAYKLNNYMLTQI